MTGAASYLLAVHSLWTYDVKSKVRSEVTLELSKLFIMNEVMIQRSRTSVSEQAVSGFWRVISMAALFCPAQPIQAAVRVY